MKVILLQDVAKVGRKGDIVNVADGYGVNSLLPSKKAIIATAEAIRRHEIAKKEKEAVSAENTKKIVGLLKSINGKNIIHPEKANDKGGLFSKLHADQVVKIIHDQTGVEISTVWLKNFKTISQLGEYDLKLEYEEEKIALNLRIVQK